MNFYRSYLDSNILSNEDSFKYSPNEAYEQRKGKWTKEEDEILRELVPLYGGKSWKKVAEKVKGRTPIQCLHRWSKILQPGLVKGPWTIQEDKKLIEWVKKYGPTKWSECAEIIKGRCGKQCRERWFNSLNPIVKKGNWAPEEDYKIYLLYKKNGSKWAKFAEYFEGRTENSIKNRFYSNLRKLTKDKNKFSFVASFDTNVYKNPSLLTKHDLLNYLELAIEEAKSRCVLESRMKDSDINEIERMVKSGFFEANSAIQKLNKALKPNETISNVSPPITNNVINSNNTINLNINISHPKFEDISNDLSSPFDFSQKNSDYYKSMDIYSLEKDIGNVCDDNNLLFQDSQFGNFESYLDNMIENMFDCGKTEQADNSKNFVFTSDPLKDCNICIKPVEAPIQNVEVLRSDLKDKKSQVDKKPDVLQSIYYQLNDLEKLIKSTKKELFKYQSTSKVVD